MIIYVIYEIDKNGYRNPIAITKNRISAAIYVRDSNEDARCHKYFIERYVIEDDITDIKH